MPPLTLSPAEVSRYQLQISLSGWGREAQERVKSSMVLLAGAGGVSSCAALYLIAGGVGALRLVDQNRVSLPDLNHQILYRERDLGKPRAAVAEARLQELNPFVKVEGRVKIISGHNISRLTQGVHLIVDTRNHTQAGQVLNHSSIRLGIPLIYVQTQGLGGRLTTFWPGRGPCQACVSLDFPAYGPTDRESSLLGPISGILGTLLALESLRILGGLGPALCGRLLTFDGQDFHLTETFLSTNSLCPSCGAGEI